MSICSWCGISSSRCCGRCLSSACDWDWTVGIDSDGLLGWEVADSFLGWLDEPDNWGGIDDGGNSLAKGGSSSGGGGHGRAWESVCGGVGITGWVWDSSWCWLSAVATQEEDWGLGIDDIGVGTVDEV